MLISHHFHDCKAPLAHASHVKWRYTKYLGFSFSFFFLTGIPVVCIICACHAQLGVMHEQNSDLCYRYRDAFKIWLAAAIRLFYSMRSKQDDVDELFQLYQNWGQRRSYWLGLLAGVIGSHVVSVTSYRNGNMSEMIGQYNNNNNNLGRKIDDNTGDNRSTIDSFLFQRISVLVQRFNVVLLNDSLCWNTTPPGLVFTPATTISLIFPPPSSTF